MPYQKQAEPFEEPTLWDLGWATGFLEGEGTFGAMSGTDRRARISAGQKHIEPLTRLLALFGGRIYTLKNRTYYTWMLRGERAHALMLLLRPSLTQRRQAQIDRAIEAGFSLSYDSTELFLQRASYRGMLGKRHTAETKARMSTAKSSYWQGRRSQKTA